MPDSAQIKLNSRQKTAACMGLLCIVGLGVGIEAMRYKQLDAPTVNRNTILTALEGIMAAALLCVFCGLLKRRWDERKDMPFRAILKKHWAILKKHWLGVIGLFVIVVLEVVKKKADLEPRQQQDLGVAQMGLFVVVVALTLWQRRKSTPSSTTLALAKAGEGDPGTKGDTVKGTGGSDAVSEDT